MSRTKIVVKPTRLSEIAWEDIYDNLSYELDPKLQRDHVKRWRQLKHKQS